MWYFPYRASSDSLLVESNILLLLYHCRGFFCFNYWRNFIVLSVAYLIQRTWYLRIFRKAKLNMHTVASILAKSLTLQMWLFVFQLSFYSGSHLYFGVLLDWREKVTWLFGFARMIFSLVIQSKFISSWPWKSNLCVQFRLPHKINKACNGQLSCILLTIV